MSEPPFDCGIVCSNTIGAVPSNHPGQSINNVMSVPEEGNVE